MLAKPFLPLAHFQPPYIQLIPGFNKCDPALGFGCAIAGEDNLRLRFLYLFYIVKRKMIKMAMAY